MRIAIVNDMKLACVALARAVTSDPRHSIAWTAIDGQEAIAQARRDRPDLILMDMIMPGVDGVEATRQIMQLSPCPILVVTSTVSGNIAKVYEAMSHGALDAVETPTLGSDGSVLGAHSLLAKITHIENLTEKSPAATPLSPQLTPTPHTRPTINTIPPTRTSAGAPRLVLIGSSTGGPGVLADLLKALPATLSASVLIAQHVDEVYASGLAIWLGKHTTLPVSVPTEGSVPLPGCVYVADSKHHLSFAADRRLHYVDEPAGWYRPSVDVLFQSAARHWPSTGVALLLTGMGRDGAAGLLALRQAGWTTIAQDQASSVVWGMPRAAIDLNAASLILPPERMISSILNALRPATATPPTSRP